MTLVAMPELLDAARRERVGLGAFNVIQVEHAEGLVAGAQAAGAPVVLQISQNCVEYHRGLAAVTAATLEVARAAAVPVVVHLDHAEDEALVREAVDRGITSVMFDGSAFPYEENVARTHQVADWCRARGVAVEAELGAIGGKDGVHAPGVRTDPVDARRFVEQTGVGSLAVAVGSSHAMRERSLTVDTALVEKIAREVPVPLVLHGSSSLDDQQLVAAVRSGMTKINISTHVNRLFTEAVRRELEADPTLVDPRRYVGAGREALAAETARLLRLLGSTAPSGARRTA